MSFRLSFFFLVTYWSYPLLGQGRAEKDSLENSKQTLRKGHFRGHVRSFWMLTNNQAELTDFHAWGVGAGLGYQTPLIAKHLQVGFSGFFMANLVSSNLSLPDPKTGQANRYEVGLFDVTQPSQTRHLNRAEELYLRYFFKKKSSVTLGRQLPKTPFINPQDGRLSPTFVEGIVFEWNEFKNTKIHAEYLYRISPRSTVGWYSIGESIGLYPVGLNTDGKPSSYAGNSHTKGIFTGGITQNVNALNIQLWNTYVESIFNTVFFQGEWKSSLNNKKSWMAGIQAIHQRATGNGGNVDATRAYFSPNGHSTIFSGRVGYRSPLWAINLNATRITAEGRYLMPREWGKEPFYTFLPRERNEGMGDTQAYSINIFYQPHPLLKWEASGGYYKLSDVKNVLLNKYGMPSYAQLNLGVSYGFSGMLKGLNTQLLVVRKQSVGPTYNNDRFVYNKVNMTHLNFIVNYQF
ncbi:MAG: OprD family outer membrane porin [Spirosomataceae bacterium]